MQVDYKAFGELLSSTMADQGLTYEDIVETANEQAKQDEFGEEILEKHITYMERGCPQGGHAYPARIVLVAKALGLEVPQVGAKVNGSVALVPAKQQAEIAASRMNGIVQQHVGDVEIGAIDTAYTALSGLDDVARRRALYYLRLRLLDSTVAEDGAEG